MVDKREEVLIEKYPKYIFIEGMNKILYQMKYNICKIYNNDGKKGSGFFCEISCGDNNNIPVLITNYHVIDENYLKENYEIELSLNDDKVFKTINLNEKRKLYTNKEYDTTIIEIKPEKDKINNFMKIDEKIYREGYSNKIFINQSIYIIHYPFSEKVAVSYGIINNIYKFDINHYCCTEIGSSGSPIINLSNHQIIGIHKLGSSHFQINKGTFLKYPINDFINKYYKHKKENNNNINEMNYFNIDNNNNVDDKKMSDNFNILKGDNDNDDNNDNSDNNDQNDNEEEEKKFSYECLNLNNLNKEIMEGIKKVKIKILLKNNKKIDWPKNNTKLVFDFKTSKFIQDDLILEPQRFNEEKYYDIIIRELDQYPAGEYNVYLWFEVNGKHYGERIEFKIIIKEKTNQDFDKIKELRKTFNLSEEDYSDGKILESLKTNNYNYELTFMDLINNI